MNTCGMSAAIGCIFVSQCSQFCGMPLAVETMAWCKPKHVNKLSLGILSKLAEIINNNNDNRSGKRVLSLRSSDGCYYDRKLLAISRIG